MCWCFGCWLTGGFPSFEGSFVLLRGDSRARWVCGLAPRGGCSRHSAVLPGVAATLRSKMLVAAAWPNGQGHPREPGPSSDALCPRVQGAMAGMSPGLLELEDAAGLGTVCQSTESLAGAGRE